MILDREWATYLANRAALLEKDVGRYVLIHGDQIVGIWDTQEEALEEGYRQFLFVPFMVHHNVAEEKPIFMPRVLIRADDPTVLVYEPYAEVCFHQHLSTALPTKGRCDMENDREWATFQANLPALLETDAGRYALIHGDQIAGTWDTQEEALEEGYRRFLLEPFLVQPIVADEKPIFVPRELV